MAQPSFMAVQLEHKACHAETLINVACIELNYRKHKLAFSLLNATLCVLEAPV